MQELKLYFLNRVKFLSIFGGLSDEEALKLWESPLEWWNRNNDYSQNILRDNLNTLNTIKELIRILRDKNDPELNAIIKKLIDV